MFKVNHFVSSNAFLIGGIIRVVLLKESFSFSMFFFLQFASRFNRFVLTKSRNPFKFCYVPRILDSYMLSLLKSFEHTFEVNEIEYCL